MGFEGNGADGRASDGYCEHAGQHASGRVLRNTQEEYLLYGCGGRCASGHYVMGGPFGQQKVSYGWVAGTGGHRVHKQL
jgi:hypothetical protein